MSTPKLYMVLLGCKPQGRHTEQHDVFFGIATSLKELVPQIHAFWPEAKNNIHIDAWRVVSYVGGYDVIVSEKEQQKEQQDEAQKNPNLFFMNLGGYKPDEFEEFHYKTLLVAENVSIAIQTAKTTAFYKHTGFKGAASHIDDKYLVDADDVHEVSSILPAGTAEKYTIRLQRPQKTREDDELELGYLQLWKIKD